MRNAILLIAVGILLVATCIICKSCTLFEKNSGSNEMESLTQDVLKKGEGVDIQVKPIIPEHCNR